MSIQRQQADTRTFESEQFPGSRSLTTALLHRIFSGLECGQLVIDTPAGERLVIDGNQPGPHFPPSMRANVQPTNWCQQRDIVLCGRSASAAGAAVAWFAARAGGSVRDGVVTPHEL